MSESIWLVITVLTFIVIAAVHFRTHVDQRNWSYELVIGSGWELRYHADGFLRQVNRKPENVTNMCAWIIQHKLKEQQEEIL